MLLHTSQTTVQRKRNLMHTGKPQNLCDSLYPDIHLLQ